MKKTPLLLSLLSLVFATALAGCPVTDKNATPMPTFNTAYFVAERGLDQVAVINPADGSVIKTLATGHAPTRLIYSGSALNIWVANAGSSTVTAIDPKTRTIVGSALVGTDPEYLGTNGNDLWVGNVGSKSITIVDSNTMTDKASINLPAAPTGIASEGDVGTMAVSLANNTVVLFDPGTYRQIGQITITGSTLDGIAGDGDTDGMCQLVLITSDGTLLDYRGNGGNYTQYERYSYPAGTYTAESRPETPAFIFNDTTNGFDEWTDSSLDGLGAPPSLQPSGNQPRGADVDNVAEAQVIANSGSDSLTISNFGSGSKTIQLQAGAKPYDVIFYDLVTTPTPSPSPTPTNTPTVSPTNTPTVSPTATPTPGTVSNNALYVANALGNDVLRFDSPSGSAATSSTAWQYTSASTSVATDGKGTMAVSANSEVLLYNNTNGLATTPFATLTTGDPDFMAFDSHGNLYATTFFNAIYKWSAPVTNSSTPTLLYVSDHNTGIAIDAADTMYVANTSGNLDVVAPPYANNSQVVLTPAAGATLSDVALFGGNLYVSDTANQKIYAYALPLTASSTPFYTYSAADPEGIAFDSAGNLYVSDDVNNRIDVYFMPGQAPLALNYSLSGNGVNSPYGLTFGP